MGPVDLDPEHWFLESDKNHFPNTSEQSMKALIFSFNKMRRQTLPTVAKYFTYGTGTN